MLNAQQQSQYCRLIITIVASLDTDTEKTIACNWALDWNAAEVNCTDNNSNNNILIRDAHLRADAL